MTESAPTDPPGAGPERVVPLGIHLPTQAPREEKPARPPQGGVISFLYTLGIVVFGVLLAKLYLDQYIQIRRLQERRIRVEANTAAVRLEHEKLAEEVEYLETLEGVERLARDKLRYIRPDEVILIPLRPENPVPAPTGP